jgi:D-aminopeptidase
LSKFSLPSNLTAQEQKLTRARLRRLGISIGNHFPASAGDLYKLKMMPHHHLKPFFEAVTEATEEAILNALAAAKTMAGFKGRTVYALPLDKLQSVIEEHHL